jgi:hypothetical protein
MSGIESFLPLPSGSSFRNARNTPSYQSSVGWDGLKWYFPLASAVSDL